MKILRASPESLSLAATAILEGKLVGMPTETVYGIAADATNEDAVFETFSAKQRPPDNPLIVHVGGIEEAEQLALTFPPAAIALAERFWPGPLTLVVRKHPSVLKIVTSGLDTVAIRVPSHPAALALLRLVKRPLSAPSANLFSQLSPTRAEHITPEVAERLALILDGGPCEVGLESTVVDVSGEQPLILRPGGIRRSAIEGLLKGPLANPSPGERRSPGMFPKHYSPRVPLELVGRLADDQPGLTFELPANDRQIQVPLDPKVYAAGLYEALYRLQSMEIDRLFVQRPPSSPEWEAVMDRLTRASAV